MWRRVAVAWYSSLSAVVTFVLWGVGGQGEEPREVGIPELNFIVV